MCGVIWIAAGMFGRWRANPGEGFNAVVRFYMGIGIELASHLGAFTMGRLDLYLAATSI